MRKRGGPFESANCDGSGRKSVWESGRRSLNAEAHDFGIIVLAPKAMFQNRLRGQRLGRAKCNERFTEHAGVRQLGRTAGCICTAGVCRSADPQGHKDRLPKLGVFPRGEGSFGDIRVGTPRPLESAFQHGGRFFSWLF